jgi:[citrate (pro-3S)-lyase] ligase
MNVSQGLRFTHGAPEAFGAAVHLIGNCLVFGVGLDDSRTVASCLQRELNAMGSAFRVLNHGVWGIEPFDFISYRERMLFLRPNPGDVVVFIVHMMFDAYFERMFNDARRVFSHLSDCFNRPRGDGALIFDYIHPSPHGAERIARHLRDMLAEDGIAARGPATACVHAVARAVRESSEARAFGDSAGAARLAPHGDTLAAYVSDLKSRRRDAAVSGAVVVNCNPFTKGHRYLIETAANTVDVLYVFVVEEDKSEIAFDDRIRMVEIGTEDIENAAVLPSGKFILSALTFPEYFLKDALQEVRIDASADVLAFAKHVAPALGVTKRFVGREPFDAVTRQYNQTLKDVLPRYGIEVVEFPRREFKGTPISASAVRRLLKARDFRGVSDLIPESTLGFLKDLFVT